MSDTEAVRSKKSVTGKRWQINGKLTIRKRGRDYMRRRYLISTPWFGIYLHHILLPDQDRGPHDHPWNMRTFILKGWYEELVLESRTGRSWNDDTMQVFIQEPEFVRTNEELRLHRRFSFMHLPTTAAHRISRLSRGGAWTLCFVGKRRREWGFVIPEQGWVLWSEENNRGEEIPG